ncbi:MAG: BLUF domain-containing protein [Proteobacteria bacterium]|nr:BLUF domain-containing protein [Pseudomonadota bacterium]
MTQDLYRLIYLSRNTIPGSNENIHQEIEQILTVSRRRNAASHITGALMFNRECFAQVLEGTHGNIQETFERIQCDPRHANVVVLDFEPVQTRRFSRWSMGYIGYDTLASKEFTRIQQATGFDVKQLSGERIYDLLHAHLYAAEKGGSNLEKIA